MTIIQAIETNGAYETARKLLNRHIKSLIFIGLDELPDTAELADISENLADILQKAYEIAQETGASKLDEESKEQIMEVLSEIDIETLQNYIL